MVIFNNETLKQAVWDWKDNPETTQTKYGHISNWDVSNVTNMQNLFGFYSSFNEDIGNWNVSKVTNMSQMFFGSKLFNQYIGKWDVSKVTNMSSMFNVAESFNQDIGDWNVSNVTKTKSTFSRAKSFNQDIGQWDVSKVTNMEQMFSSAKSFNQDISKWDVSNVNEMKSMFWSAISFNQDIGKWNVSNVTNMEKMFDRAESFDQDITQWDVSSVKKMWCMFSNEDMFNQYRGKWNVNNVTDKVQFYSNGKLLDEWKTNVPDVKQDSSSRKPNKIPRRTIYIIHAMEINNVILKEGNEVEIDGSINCEKWDFGDVAPLYIFNPCTQEVHKHLNGILLKCKRLDYIEGSDISIEDLNPVDEHIIELTFNDVFDNKFVIVGGIIVDNEIWSNHRNLFTHLPYDDLTEASDEDEDNFDNTRYFGRCEGSVDTITFVGGIEGFYFTGNYFADYMEVVLEE